MIIAWRDGSTSQNYDWELGSLASNEIYSHAILKKVNTAMVCQ